MDYSQNEDYPTTLELKTCSEYKPAAMVLCPAVQRRAPVLLRQDRGGLGFLAELEMKEPRSG